MHLRLIALAVCLSLALLSETQDGRPQSRRLRADLNFLCSDTLAGRVSLSREADTAARYIAAEFEKLGLEPVAGGSYLQPFSLIAYRSDPARRLLAITRANRTKRLSPGTEFNA